MKKQISILAVAVFVLALFVPMASAQTGSVKGVVKDDKGAPLVGVTVELTSMETGRKYQLKSDKNGRIFSLGVAPGKYDVKVIKDGAEVFHLNGWIAKLDENVLDIDLAKERQMAQTQMTEEQKKQIEQVNKENQTIKGLNEKLALAKAATDAGNPEEAVKVLTEATQMDPNRELIWFRLADAQRAAAAKAPDAAAKKAGYEGSIESYKKAISLAGNLKPDVLGAAYNNMGESYAKTGQTEEAIKSYEQAVQADPTRAAGYYFNEGAILTNTNKFKEANDAFDKAIQADPTKADAYYQKGANGINLATLNKEGKMVAPAGTEEAFNKYLELSPDGKFAEQAKAMLTALGAKIETSYGKGKTTPAAKKK